MSESNISRTTNIFRHWFFRIKKPFVLVFSESVTATPFQGSIYVIFHKSDVKFWGKCEMVWKSQRKQHIICLLLWMGVYIKNSVKLKFRNIYHIFILKLFLPNDRKTKNIANEFADFIWLQLALRMLALCFTKDLSQFVKKIYRQ